MEQQNIGKKKKLSAPELIKKAVLIVLAALCIGTGVGIILYAGVGSDTITVFQDGMVHIMHLSLYRYASLLYNAVLIPLALLLARKHFGLGTIFSALLTSLFIDPPLQLLESFNWSLSYPVRMVVFLIGLVIYALGLSLLIRCRLGMNCLDSLVYALCDVTHLGYKPIRIAADLALAVTGWLMGGVIGVGTVISIVATGIIVDTFVKIGRKDEKVKKKT